METILRAIFTKVFEFIGVMVVLFIQMGVVISFINMILS